MPAPISIGLLLPASHLCPAATSEIAKGFHAFWQAKRNAVAGRAVDIQDCLDAPAGQRGIDAIQSSLVNEDMDILVANIGYTMLPDLARMMRMQNKLLFLVSAGADIVREEDRNALIFRNSLQYWQSSYLAGRWAGRTLGGELLRIPSMLESGFDAQRALQAGFEAEGGTLSHLTFSDAPDYTLHVEGCLKAIAEHKPSSLAMFSAGCDAMDLLTALNEAAIIDPSRCVDSAFMHEPPIPRKLGKILSGRHSFFGWSDDLLNADTPQSRDFIRDFAEISPRRADAFSVLGYETAAFIFKAIEAADGDTEAVDIMGHALEEMSVSSPRGEISMDAISHSTNAPVYMREMKWDGKRLHQITTETLTAPKDSDPEMLKIFENRKSSWYQDYPFA